MPIHNSYVGQIFNDLADLLEIEGANPFRIRAYRNAARVVSQWPQSLADILHKKHDLPKLPGLGTDLSAKVKEILLTGKLSFFEKQKKKLPQELSTLLRVPGLGPKRILLLRNRLGIGGLKDLKAAAIAGRIRELPGFGEKTEQHLLQQMDRARVQPKRIPFFIAEQIAEPLLSYLRAWPEVRQAEIAGSYRRKQETVGDLDLLVSSTHSTQVMDRFIKYEEVNKILSHGPTKSTVLLRSGIQVDLRVIPEESFGAALHYFTGSKAHNIAIRTLGLRKGLKINEYGVFRGKRRISGRTEEEVYHEVGLPYIEPELRESRSEIEAAAKNHLPQLVTLKDIRGDLHAHTRATDGRLTLEEIAQAAQERGYEYLAITDHSKHLTVAKGLTPQRLKQQIRQIDQLNSRLNGIRILKSIEVDILEDGQLDLPDKILSELDLRVCSIHSKFDLSEKKQTERIIRAMDNPYFNILGHPTGRLIDQRSPYEVNLEQLMTAARERGCFFEVNSQPDRMDLTDIYCQMAKDFGVRVSISSDAHSLEDLDNLRFGVSQARRGGLEATDVLNTYSWSKLKSLMKRR